MSSKSIGRKLEEIRKRLKKTRKEVARDLTTSSAAPMSEITVYKYERGILEPPEQFLEKFAKKYQKHGVKLADITELRRLDRPLRIGLGPYPDFAFFCAVAKPGLLEAHLHDLPEIEAEIRSVEYRDILASVTKGGQAKDGIDVALYNENDFAKEVASHAAKVVNLGPVLTYRGYAVLSTSFPDWKVFSQCYLLNSRQRRTRNKRIGDSLRETLAQVERETKGAAIVCTAGKTDRQNVLLELVRLAHEHEQQDGNDEHLDRLEARTRSLSLTEVKAFQEFCDALAAKPQKPAVFLGGLAHRLKAEDLGAAVLVGGDDLRTVAALELTRLSKLFQPHNVVLVNAEAFDKGFDQVDALCRRWNDAVERLRSSSDFGWINPLVDAQLKDYHPTASSGGTANPEWPEGARLFERIINEDLIQFEHWNLKEPK